MLAQLFRFAATILAVLLLIAAALTAYEVLYDKSNPYNFMRMVADSNEEATKASLTILRTGVESYRGAKGSFPADLRYLKTPPHAKTPGFHADSSAVHYGRAPNDSGGWVYDNVEGDAHFGEIRVNCTHTDKNGTIWSAY